MHGGRGTHQLLLLGGVTARLGLLLSLLPLLCLLSVLLIRVAVLLLLGAVLLSSLWREGGEVECKETATRGGEGAGKRR